MEDIKVDISGEMHVPHMETRKPFDLSSWVHMQNIPSPLEMLQTTRQSIRPWSEFLSASNYKSVASMPRLTSRLMRNLKYFQSNYIFVSLVLMIYCLITSPLILLVICCVAYASYRIKNAQVPVSIFGYQLTTNQQIMTVNLASLPILVLVGAGAALFWILGASCFVIFMHATFYNIDAIVTEEADGFLSEVI